LTCPDGSFLNSMNQCVTCRNDEYFFDNTCVSTCPYSYQQNQAKGICEKCPTGCTSCSTSAKCETCSRGYYLDTTTYTCKACAKNCAACSSATTCDACKDPYLLSALKTCVKSCSADEYIDSSLIEVVKCSKCQEQNCKTCSQNGCLTCSPGFYMDFNLQ